MPGKFNLDIRDSVADWDVFDSRAQFHAALRD